MRTITSRLCQEITNWHANICSALADPKPFLILLRRCTERPCNVNTIAEELGITQSAASRHLNLLRERGLVTSRREGQSVVNALTDPRVIEALDLLRAVLTSKLKNQAALAGPLTASPETF